MPHTYTGIPMFCLAMLLALLPPTTPSTYPSAAWSLILPGGHQVPTAPSVLAKLPTSDSVAAWEVGHSDASFGGNFGPVLNQKLGAMLGYMYAQVRI